MPDFCATLIEALENMREILRSRNRGSHLEPLPRTDYEDVRRVTHDSGLLRDLARLKFAIRAARPRGTVGHLR